MVLESSGVIVERWACVSIMYSSRKAVLMLSLCNKSWSAG